jgi:hypothetical protein
LNEAVLEVSSANNDALMKILEAHPSIKKISVHQSFLHLIVDEATDAAAINEYCFSEGIVLNKLQVKKKSLETKFFELMN